LYVSNSSRNISLLSRDPSKMVGSLPLRSGMFAGGLARFGCGLDCGFGCAGGCTTIGCGLTCSAGTLKLYLCSTCPAYAIA
jgi:hypothetical protein